METLTGRDVRVSPEAGAALALAGTPGLGPASIRRLIDENERQLLERGYDLSSFGRPRATAEE